MKINDKLLEHKEYIKQAILDGQTYKFIGSNLNYSGANIYQFAALHNIARPPRSQIRGLASKYKDEIIRLMTVEQLNESEISKILKLPKNFVVRHCKKWGLIQYKLGEIETGYFSLDENYFDVIDTPNKAYLLGLLYADGCVYKNKVRIVLVEKDKEILEQAKKDLCYGGELKYLVPKNSNRQNCWDLTIVRASLPPKLKKIGCMPQKSFLIRFPDENIVGLELQKFFIAGFIMGDGSVSTRYPKDTKKSNSISFATNYNFANDLRTLLMSKFNINLALPIRKKIYSNKSILQSCYNLHINKIRNICLIGSWLYSDENFNKCDYLKYDRKANKFKKWYNFRKSVKLSTDGEY